MTLDDSSRSRIKHFRDLEDPRDGTKARHKLLDMSAISVAAVICGSDDWVSNAAFARAKEAWLRQVLELPNGIPSHDTFRRVFALLAPPAFEDCFRAWVNTVRQAIPEEVVAIDGASVRRSHTRGAGLGPLGMGRAPGR